MGHVDRSLRRLLWNRSFQLAPQVFARYSFEGVGYPAQTARKGWVSHPKCRESCSTASCSLVTDRKGSGRCKGWNDDGSFQLQVESRQSIRRQETTKDA